MEQLLKILNEIDDDIEWEQEQKLIDERILDSLTVISMIAELEDVYEISIGAQEIKPENLNSVDAIYEMICRLQEK